MKKIFWYFLPLIFLVNFSCVKDTICKTGNGDFVSDVRSVPAFSSLKLENDVDVVITPFFIDCGTPPLPNASLQIHGQRNMLNILETSINNQVLKVKFSECVGSHSVVSIIAPMYQVNEVEVSGSGNVLAQNKIENSELSLYVSGSGDIVMDSLKIAKGIFAKISGSGDINLKGDTTSLLEIEIAASGNIVTSNLCADKVKIKITGSGNCKVNVLTSLEVDILGSGNVVYTGNPTIKSNITGSGKIVKGK